MADETQPNRPKWQAETQDPERAEKIREALKEVADPELGLNVIELGLVRDLVFESGKIAATVILTTPFCPYGPAMIEQMRRTIAEAGQTPTSIELGREMWDRSMMEEGAGEDWGFFAGF